MNDFSLHENVKVTGSPFQVHFSPANLSSAAYRKLFTYAKVNHVR